MQEKRNIKNSNGNFSQIGGNNNPRIPRASKDDLVKSNPCKINKSIY